MGLRKKIVQLFLKEELAELEKFKENLLIAQAEQETLINETFQTLQRNYLLSQKDLREAREQYKDAKKIVSEIVQVGVDVHMKESGSWAVLCIEGNPEYIKFVRFEQKDIRELAIFLKRFEYSRTIVDAPMLPKEFFLKY